MNISRRIPSFIVFVFLAFATWPTQAQLLQEGVPQLQRVETPPAFGTFWFVLNKAPYPFDPYHGALPIFEVGGGIYLIDDTSLFDSLSLDGGGMMSLMSGPTPPGLAGTNSVTNLLCNSLTNFTVGYRYATNGLALGIAQTTNPWVALTIQTATTSASYDLFGTTNLAELALPSLSRTNWKWLMRANGKATNFSWGQTNWCERYFQAADLTDSDNDGMSDAIERLFRTSPTNANSARPIYEGVISNQNPSAWFKLNDTNLADVLGGASLTIAGGAWDVDAFAIGNGAFSFTASSHGLTGGDVVSGGTGTNRGSMSLRFRAIEGFSSNTPRYMFYQNNDFGAFFEPTNTSSGSPPSLRFLISSNAP